MPRNEYPRLAWKQGGIESGRENVHRDSLTSVSHTERDSDHGQDSGRVDSLIGEVGEGDGTVTFGETRSIPVQNHRDVRVLGRRRAEQSREIRLPGCRAQQIVTPYHLVDAGRGVVDDHGQVVRRRPVVATQDEVVDVAGERTVQRIVDGELRDVGAQPDRGRPGAASLITLGIGEIAAGAGVGTLRGVWRGRRVKDLPTSAEALEGAPLGGQPVDHRRVHVAALGLTDHRLGPPDAERCEVSELTLLGTLAHAVEVFHTDEEPSARRAGEQIGEDRGPQISDVQVTGRRGSEAPGGRDVENHGPHRMPRPAYMVDVNTWAYAGVSVLMAVGLVGIVVPLLPGTVLVAAGILIWAILSGGTAWWVFAAAVACMAGAWIVKYVIGGRSLAKSDVGRWSLVVGGLLGIIGFFVVPVIGLPLGFIVGTVVAEAARLKDLKAGWTGGITATKTVGLLIVIELAGALAAVAAWLGYLVAT
jgi:uncharacterized protein YqgC (DUF456 family)